MSWIAGLLLLAALPDDQPHWGERGTRNMVSAERNLPDSVDPASGKGLRWSVPLGSETYSTPVVAGGRVYLGTNNQRPRDPRFDDDRGVLLCLDERDGALLWQLALPKRGPTPYWDWPKSGMSSTATVDDDRVYMVTNRGEVACLDPAGMKNGNDGPFRDEAALLGKEPGPADADVLWLCDLVKEAGVRQHDAAHASALVHDGLLYVNTSNGLDDRHSAVEKPDAPSLVAIDRSTGAIVAREREGIGRGTFHSTWSSPSLGEAKGKPLVLFGGGDGVVYAFEPRTLARAWSFDCDPEAPKKDIHRFIRNRREGPSNIKGMPVFHGGRVYVTHGGDVWWGKAQSWLKCLDASDGRLLWSAPLVRHSMCTPAVKDGLVYVADCGGSVHCLEAESGKPVWTHDAEGETWASPLVADGKVYVGTRKGVLWTLAEGREKRVIASARLDGPIHSTVTAANGTLYVATMRTLHAAAK
jgi:outer membrane protein assembly factor BamB